MNLLKNDDKKGQEIEEKFMNFGGGLI